MERTAQQQAFAGALLRGTGHLALVARAGTGKTTTIISAVVDYVAAFPHHEVTICAFGRAIREEIEAKLERAGLTNWKQVQAATSHSMGWGLVRFAFRLSKDDIKETKVRDLVRAQNAPVYREFEAAICQLVHLAKLEGFGFFPDCQIGDAAAWYRIADHYDVNGFDDTSSMDVVVEAAQHIYRQSLAQTQVVDYDDMVLFPLVKNLRVKFQRDLIIIDEYQDTSRARRAMLRKFLKPRGRMALVGDDRQAIMGFAGASADAMGEGIRELGAEVLPLTMTWRCPRAVVREAQSLVPDIQAADGAPEGQVEQVEALPEQLLQTDAILCRNTAPLVETAYRLIRRKVPCKVEGREIGTGLVKMLTRWKSIKTTAAYLDRLEDWEEREAQKLTAKGKDDRVQEVRDRAETLRVICGAVQAEGTIAAAVRFVEDMFADDVTGVLTLCTYHRSKGREWPRVFLLEHAKRCPSPFARQDWQRRQEDNLAYVAITRAQHTLAYIN
jgi:DNA helicase-2/ATP-dependent DNA helicase PcrA